MTSHYTVLALTALAGVLLCDGKSTDILQIIQHKLKSDHHKTWQNYGWNATVRGTLGMTLLSHYKIPFNVNINQKGGPYKIYSDCTELKRKTVGLSSGVYTIRPQKKAYSVYCDMTTNGGGWTVFQRRFDGSVNFYRTWTDYKNGFGNSKGEYWLGNDALYDLTRSGSYSLRVEMKSLSNSSRYAEYRRFSVGSESSGYKLYVTGYSGNAGDSLSYHNGQKFTTKDRDNDKNSNNCAAIYKGAWWYYACYKSSLNGLYPNVSSSKQVERLNWNTSGFVGRLKESKMMIKKI